MDDDMNVNYSKNVTVMSFGFFFVFFAFNTVQALTTTIIPNADLGHISLAVLYFFFVIFCFLAPEMVNKLGPRMSMTIGALPYLFMVLAFLIPVNHTEGCNGVKGCWEANKVGWIAHIALNALVGMGAPLLWTGEGVYLGRCAVRHAQQTDIRKEEATSKFNGLFFSFFQANGIVGCAGASAILSANLGQDLIFILAAACCGGVLILFFFVATVKPPAQRADAPYSLAQSLEEAEKQVDSISISDVFRQLVSESKMTLLMPIIFYNGMSLGFLFADYNGSVAKVALGKNEVGFVQATFYGANVLATSFFGWVAGRRAGRSLSLTVASLIHIGFYAMLLSWGKHIPVYEEGAAVAQMTWVYVFGGSAAFAMGDAVFESQPPAILQGFFGEDDDANKISQANMKMIQSLGFTVQFICGFSIDSLVTKVYILLALLAIGVLSMMYLHFSVKSLDGDNDLDEEGEYLLEQTRQ
jgi:MFS family permease